jgi:hypothetical protein
LPVRHVAEGDGSLRDRVSGIPPGINELVEVEVERAEQRTNHGPMRLLGAEGQVDQVVEGGLQLPAERLALVRPAKGWPMAGGSD